MGSLFWLLWNKGEPSKLRFDMMKIYGLSFAKKKKKKEVNHLHLEFWFFLLKKVNILINPKWMQLESLLESSGALNDWKKIAESSTWGSLALCLAEEPKEMAWANNFCLMDHVILGNKQKYTEKIAAWRCYSCHNLQKQGDTWSWEFALAGLVSF